MRKKKSLVLLYSVGISFLAGGIGSVFTYSAIPTWYAQLSKPFFNPPNWLFGPVWSLLYVCMGISLFLIYTTKTKETIKNGAVSIFYVQLVLNAVWSILFFGLKNPGIALVEIICLWLFILLTIVRFDKINRIAGGLLIPYLLWVSFASVLNLSIVILN